MQRSKRKFENNFLEQVAQKISIDKLELSTTLATLEISIDNLVSLFVKFSDTSIFTKEIKDKLFKIDEDIKASAH